MTPMSKKKVEPIDYIAYLIAYVAGFVKGLWTGLSQIPGYVRASVRSEFRPIERKQKERVDGKTPRERYLDATRPRPNQPEE